MLQCLEVATLARLRGTCQAARELVDGAGLVWKAAAGRVVNPVGLPAARDALAVQSILRQQGQLAAGLTSGIFSRSYSC